MQAANEWSSILPEIPASQEKAATTTAVIYLLIFALTDFAIRLCPRCPPSKELGKLPFLLIAFL